MDLAPTILVVDKEGKVVHGFTGKLAEGLSDYTAVSAAIERALGKS